jgi:large subunit ribosomal protein L29
MSILKTKQIREMRKSELDEKMKEMKLEMSKEMASNEIGANIKNPGKIREIRRTIARILTIRRESEKSRNRGDKK